MVIEGQITIVGLIIINMLDTKEDDMKTTVEIKEGVGGAIMAEVTDRISINLTQMHPIGDIMTGLGIITMVKGIHITNLTIINIIIINTTNFPSAIIHSIIPSITKTTPITIIHICQRMKINKDLTHLLLNNLA